jgi:hypothetical protein
MTLTDVVKKLLKGEWAEPVAIATWQHKQMHKVV